MSKTHTLGETFRELEGFMDLLAGFHLTAKQRARIYAAYDAAPTTGDEAKRRTAIGAISGAWKDAREIKLVSANSEEPHGTSSFTTLAEVSGGESVPTRAEIVFALRRAKQAVS